MTSVSNEDMRDFVTRAKSSHKTQWNKLWEEFYHLVWNWLIAFLISKGVQRQDAEDAVHDVVVAVMDSFKRVKHPAAFKMYIIRIVQSVAERYRTRVHYGLDVAYDVQLNAPADWYLELEEALDGLPPELRQVLDRIYFQGQTRKEAAEEMDCTESRVKKLVARATAKLHSELQPPIIARIYFIDAKHERYESGVVLPVGGYQIGISLTYPSQLRHFEGALSFVFNKGIAKVSTTF